MRKINKFSIVVFFMLFSFIYKMPVKSITVTTTTTNHEEYGVKLPYKKTTIKIGGEDTEIAVYCSEFYKVQPNGVGCDLINISSDNNAKKDAVAVGYILNHKNSKGKGYSYAVKEIAINAYLGLYGCGGSGCSYTASRDNGDCDPGRAGYKNSLEESCKYIETSDSGNVIKKIADAAKNYAADYSKSKNLGLSIGAFTYNNGSYIASATVTGTSDQNYTINYDYSKASGLSCKTLNKYNNKFDISCTYTGTASSVSLTANIYYTRSSYYTSKRYDCGSNYQKVFTSEIQTEAAKATDSANLALVGSIEITKTNKNGTRLNGVGFTLFKDSTCGTSTGKTDSTKTIDKVAGRLIFENLTPGTYSIKETTPKNNYYTKPFYNGKETECISVTVGSSKVNVSITNKTLCEYYLDTAVPGIELQERKDYSNDETAKIGLITAYNNFLSKQGTDYKGLLNFSYPTCSVASPATSTPTNTCYRTTLTYNKTNFGKNNVSGYTETLSIGGKTAYCIMDFDLDTEFLRRYNNVDDFIISGTIIFQDLANLGVAKLTKTCYVYGVAKDKINQIRTENYKVNFSNYISKIEILNNEMSLLNLNVTPIINTSEYESNNKITFTYSLNLNKTNYVERISGLIKTSSCSLNECKTITGLDTKYSYKNKTEYVGYDSKQGIESISFLPIVQLGEKYGNGTITSNSSEKCNYKFINELNVPDLKLEFRIIDTKNPFPGKNGNGRTIGKNWCAGQADMCTSKSVEDYNTSATISRDVKEHIINAPSSDSGDSCTKYKIILDSERINKIRQYNKSHKYTDFDLTCDSEGNNCESNFIKQYVSVSDNSACVADLLENVDYNEDETEYPEYNVSEEKICNLNTGWSKQVGAKYTCHLDTDRTFYVLENNPQSDNITLIMDRNFTGNGVPLTTRFCYYEQQANNYSGCTYSNGPVANLINSIQDALGTNVTVQIPTAEQILRAANIDNSEIENWKDTDKYIPLGKKWLYVNLGNSTYEAYGYWTADKCHLQKNSQGAYAVFASSNLGYDGVAIGGDYIGVRPTITLSKSKLD